MQRRAGSGRMRWLLWEHSGRRGWKRGDPRGGPLITVGRQQRARAMRGRLSREGAATYRALSQWPPSPEETDTIIALVHSVFPQPRNTKALA